MSGAFVGYEINALAIFVIPDRPAALKHIAGINFGKALVVTRNTSVSPFSAERVASRS